MGNMGTVSGAYGGTTHDSGKLQTTSSVSSEDQILYDVKKHGMGNKSIVVSRQVDIDRSGA